MDETEIPGHGPGKGGRRLPGSSTGAERAYMVEIKRRQRERHAARGQRQVTIYMPPGLHATVKAYAAVELVTVSTAYQRLLQAALDGIEQAAGDDAA